MIGSETIDIPSDVPDAPDVLDAFLRRADLIGAHMKRHPFVTIGIGLGLGYLIARLVRR